MKTSSVNVLGALFQKLLTGGEYRLWGVNHISDIGNNTFLIDRHICWKTDLQKLSCLIYSFNYC